MEQSLVDATKSGDIDALHGFLKQDPFLLESIDKIPFVDTPLHLASSCGQTHFAVEVLSLKPSFGRKLNPDGFSPLDLALRSGQRQTVQKLAECDPELIRVKGKERFTPLHYVAQTTDGNLLVLFFLKNPKSIEDSNFRGETAFHVAARNANVDALRVLLGWLQRNPNYKQILNRKDGNGNTVLHIAAATNDFEAVRLLIRGRVKINHRNQDGLTALDIAMGHPNAGRVKCILRSACARRSNHLPNMKNLSEDLVFRESLCKRMLIRQGTLVESLQNLSDGTRNLLLVVTVLVATATYQAILSPPGGLVGTGNDGSTSTNAPPPVAATDPDQYPGTAQMGWVAYDIFLVLNTVPFFAAVGMIVALLPKTNHNYLVVVPLLSRSFSYCISAAIISPKSRSIVIILFVVFIQWFIVSALTLNLSSIRSKCHQTKV